MPEVDQDDFAVTDIFGEFVHFAFSVWHFEIGELLSYSDLFQYIQMVDHIADARNGFERRVCFGDDFILLLFADIVTEIVEILGGRLFIRMSQDIVDNGFRNLTVDLFIFGFRLFNQIFITRLHIGNQFVYTGT